MRYVLSQVAFQFGVAGVEPNAEMERGPILKISPSSAGLIRPPHSFLGSVLFGHRRLAAWGFSMALSSLG